MNKYRAFSLRILTQQNIRIFGLVFMTLLLGACNGGNTVSNNSDVPVGVATPDPAPVEPDPAPVEPDPAPSTGAATLNWLPPTDNTDGSTLTDLAGYRIYYGLSPDSMTNVITNLNVGLTAYVIENLQGNTTYYFGMTAIDIDGVESDFSNIVSKTIIS